MKLESFNGVTPADALRQAQEKFGDHALVVSTKEVKRKGFNSPGLYEVVVAIEDNANEVISTHDKHVHKDISPTIKKEKSPLENITEAAKEISQIVHSEVHSETLRPMRTNKRRENDISAEVLENLPTIKEYKELRKEIEKLGDKVGQIQDAIWEDKSENRNFLDIPPEFANIYKKAKMSGMDREHLDMLMKLTVDNMPVGMRTSSATIDRYFNLVLKKMIPVRFERPISEDAKKIMMFVGPTGVGKTTSVAKIAARYALDKEREYKVGIISLDNYRVGAAAQLREYATTLQLPIETAVDNAEFERSLMALSYCDLILVDTAGSSQYDMKRIKETEHYLHRSEAMIDVNLVLSANTKYEDMLQIYKSFASLDIDTLLFTKVDETATLGNLFSVIYETKKPVSYISNGQEVPDDITPASATDLVDNVLDGYKKQKEQY